MCTTRFSVGVLGLFLPLVAWAQLSVNPPAIAFTGNQGGPDPAAQAVTLTSSSGTVPWTATISYVDSPTGWLTVSPLSGSVSPNNPVTLKFSVSLANVPVASPHAILEVNPGGQLVHAFLVVGAPAPAQIALNTQYLLFVSQPGTDPAPQTVQITNAGSGTLNWTAVGEWDSGGNWLTISPSSGTAPTVLAATVFTAGLVAGNYPGFISVSATSDSNAVNSPQEIEVMLALGTPAISPNGAVNGASFSVDGTVSPGSVVSLFGANLSSGNETAGGAPLPSVLSDTAVMINYNGAPDYKAAPLYFVSPGQINFQMPMDAAGSSAIVYVVSNNQTGPLAQLNLAPAAPGIFSSQGQGSILNEDFSLNSAANPAAAGSVIQVFATGLGVTNPPLASGQPGATSSPYNMTVIVPAALINGAPAPVQFSAIAPGFVGLYQVNIQVPASTPPNPATSLQFQMNGRGSNVVTFAVR